MVKWNYSQEFISNVGKAGSGKSRYFDDNVLPYLPLAKLHIYDYNGEYSEYKKKVAGYYQPDVGTVQELDRFLWSVFKQGNCIAFIEDGEEAMSETSPVQRKYFLRARNRNIGNWFNIKAPQSVKPFFRGRFDKLNIFQLTDYRHIDAAEQWAGVRKDDLAEKIRSLKPGEHIQIDFKADYEHRIQFIEALPLKGGDSHGTENKELPEMR